MCRFHRGFTPLGEEINFFPGNDPKSFSLLHFSLSFLKLHKRTRWTKSVRNLRLCPVIEIGHIYRNFNIADGVGWSLR